MKTANTNNIMYKEKSWAKIKGREQVEQDWKDKVIPNDFLDWSTAKQTVFLQEYQLRQDRPWFGTTFANPNPQTFRKFRQQVTRNLEKLNSKKAPRVPNAIVLTSDVASSGNGVASLGANGNDDDDDDDDLSFNSGVSSKFLETSNDIKTLCFRVEKCIEAQKSGEDPPEDPLVLLSLLDDAYKMAGTTVEQAEVVAHYKGLNLDSVNSDLETFMPYMTSLSASREKTLALAQKSLEDVRFPFDVQCIVDIDLILQFFIYHVFSTPG